MMPRSWPEGSASDLMEAVKVYSCSERDEIEGALSGKNRTQLRCGLLLASVERKVLEEGRNSNGASCSAFATFPSEFKA